jgi:cell division protein FtsI/penicillin-binding protein 2
LTKPVVLAGDPAIRYAGGQFTWQVRTQLESILGSAEAVDTGGYRVITTLDWRAQQIAQKYMTAAVIVPNVKRQTGEAMLRSLKIPRSDLGWIRALRGKDLHNGALVALDYRTGDVLAYIGSAGYDRDNMASAKFSPKFDAAGRWLAPARLRVQADPVLGGLRREEADPRQPAPRRDHDVQQARGLGPARRRPARARSRAGAQRRSSTR